MKFFVFIFLMCHCVLLAGCYTAGEEIERGTVSEIKEGVTTRAEVEQRLGQPSSVTVAPNGDRLLVYSYVENNPRWYSFLPFAPSHSDHHYQTLQVWFDDKNTVKYFEFTDTAGETTGYFGTHRKDYSPSDDEFE